MQRELTITIDEQVYEALYKIAGQQNISQIIEGMLRPYILVSSLETSNHTTVTEERFYDELHKLIEKHVLNQIFTDVLHNQHLITDLEAGYRAMAADAEYEAEALEWIEGTIGDAFDETR